MVLLSTVLAIEALFVLSIAMFIDGRRAAPSIWIRSDILLGVVANVAVALLISGLAGVVVTVMGAMKHGVGASIGAIHLLATVLSVVVTWFVLKRLVRHLPPAAVPAMVGAAAEAMPQVPGVTMPPPGSPGNGAMAS